MGIIFFGLQAKGHRAETQARNGQAGAAEFAVLHGQLRE
jgi:hypothetical protein